MRTILYLLQKEFIQIFRNKTILPLIFILPVLQLLILVNAATMTMKNLRVEVVDSDHSQLSRQLLTELQASPFFVVAVNDQTVTQAVDELEKSTADLVLVIPRGLEKSLTLNNNSTVQVLADAVNSQQAQLGYAYLQQVITRLGRNLQVEMATVATGGGIVVSSRYWFNPGLNYKFFMFPGILVILVSVIGMFLTAINLVREKEMGTIEQMNVTPVRKSQFIIAKLVPFWVIGLFELAFGLLIGKLIYGIPMVGSLWLLFGMAAIYLIGLLGLGLLISTFSASQQQVTFVSYFFLLVFILMSGIFTSVDNMPQWGRWLNTLNPVYYFIDIVRSILLKGAGFRDLLAPFTAISVLAVALVSLAVRNYRKTV
ncbi:ABC transporter permease [Geofilum sp. OHC36d9]|uniref:ABC transporter permease n=1 Tax=Geofilum sp. OHC36d9 TaxID=3458413 RepID=UPI004034C6ED